MRKNGLFQCFDLRLWCFFCAIYLKNGAEILRSELELQYDIKKIKIIKLHGQKNQGKKEKRDVK